MVNELKDKLVALGMDAEMAVKVIATVAEFAKAKLPTMVHPSIDAFMEGKDPDLGRVGGLLAGFKGMFGGK